MSFCQIINRLRSFPIYCSTARRFVHNQHNAKVLVPLTHRKILKVSGKDAPNFLQGLITNDMRHFEDNAAKSIYAMFLNNKGRVMFDTLIYKWDDNDTFLVECDEKCMASLKNHLKLFKLKQAVNIEDMDKHLHLWALMSLVDSLPTFKTDMNSPISILKDPRLMELGCRILTVPTMEVSDILKVVAIDNVKLGDEKVYKYLRYKLGVGEGPEELPPGLCFPLEVNCDYLHGVSFHKGCYIGQELTARVHHTGVVRKRLMPIQFNNVLTNSVEKDTVIKSANNPKSNLGKLKAFMLDYGLGLVRIKEALEAKQLVVEETSCKVLKPTWWPLEAPKEKIAPRTD